MVFDPTILAPLGFGATFVLAVVASLFVSGIIVPGKLLDRAERNTEAALKNNADLLKDNDRMVDAIDKLTTELRENRLRGR